MEVSVDQAEGLERRMKVQVPAERVEDAVEQKLRTVGRNAKISGFRPGKVPLKVLRQRFGDSVRQEVVSELLQSTYPEALGEAELTPAGQPRIELDEQAPGAGLAYTAIFDVYPEIDFKGLDSASIEQPQAEVRDEDVEKTIERMREQNKTFEPVEREAREGDQATIDFRGTIDGEEFSGNSGEDIDLEIGSGRFLDEMEEDIKGHKAGETFNVEVNFPEDYGAENLRGKTAQFEVTLKKVGEPVLPEIDDEFLKRMGIEEGGIDALREKVRTSLEKELEKAIRNRVKKQVMDALIERNPMDLPESLVAQEIDRMRHEAMHQMPGQQHDHEKMREMLPDDLFREGARRRVHLGLLLNEAISSKEIELDRDRVEQTLQELAGEYESAEQVMQYYRSNREVMQGIEAMVMEDQVVDALTEEAEVKPVDSSLDELMENQQQ